MKTSDLANVALKLLGIFCFVQAIPLLLQGVMMPFMGLQNMEGFNWKLQMVFMFLYIALYLLAGYLFVFRTPFILRLMALDTDASGPVANDPPPSYAQLAFSLLGAFFAISSVGPVLSSIIKLIAQWNEATANNGMFRQAIIMNILPDLTDNAVKLIIGIALILGREKLERLWTRLRPLAAKGERE